MPKFTLDVVDEYPYIVLGINTSLKNYRLAWSLNCAFGITFRREQMLEVPLSRNEKTGFTFFTTFVEHENAQYRLVENRSGGHLFIPEYPRADYVLVIDQSPEIEADEIIKKVRGIKAVSTAFLISIEPLKSKHNILLTT